MTLSLVQLGNNDDPRHPEKVLLEIRRVLKPDGMVCITDLTRDSAFAKVIDNRQRKIEPEHIGFYSTKEYQKMFTQAGLEYIKTKTITLTMMKVHLGKIGQTQLACH